MAKRPAPGIPSGPLFERLKGRADAAAFARVIGVSPQVVSNWRHRGVPSAMLPKVAAVLGITVEAYLEAAGRPVHRLEQPVAPYLSAEERQLLDNYRRAHPRWQLTLQLLAKLESNGNQDEVAESMNILLAKIAAEPVADERLGPAWTRPDRRKP